MSNIGIVTFILLLLSPILHAQTHNNSPNYPSSSRQNATSNYPSPQPIISPQQHVCVEQGDLIHFSGQHLTLLTHSQFKIQTDRMPMLIKPVQLSQQKISFKLLEKLPLTAGRSYMINMTSNQNQQNLPPQSLRITLCASNQSTLTGFTLNREKNQLLALSSTTHTNSIIHTAERLGLSLIKHDKLKQLAHDLLVFEANEKTINADLQQLRLHFPDIDFDFNHHYQSASSPRHYAKDQINWPKATSCFETKTITKLNIGIIDGLPDLSQLELAHQAITVQSFLNDNEQADKQHATAIAGILVGEGSEQQSRGLLPHSRLVAAVVLRRDMPNSIATAQSIVRALDWLIGQHVRLINFSLAGKQHNTIITKSIEQAVNNNVLLFAAAGNDGMTKQVTYPAALPNVFAITAIDAAQRLYRHANQGSYIDFAAPGVDIWTMSDDKGQGKYHSGTSFANPYAVAIAAQYVQAEPKLSPEMLYKKLKLHTIDLGNAGHDTTFGWGLVQASNQCH